MDTKLKFDQAYGRFSKAKIDEINELRKREGKDPILSDQSDILKELSPLEQYLFSNFLVLSMSRRDAASRISMSDIKAFCELIDMPYDLIELFVSVVISLDSHVFEFLDGRSKKSKSMKNTKKNPYLYHMKRRK